MQNKKVFIKSSDQNFKNLFETEQIVHALEGHVSLKDLDEGMQPGHSTSFNFAGRSNCDVRKYFENMKKSNMTLESQEYGMMSRYSGSTSEYGLNPSDSSSEFPQRT